jgi:hypothetical protein
MDRRQFVLGSAAATAALATTVLVSARIRVITASGVPFGANSPTQIENSTS